MLIAAVGLGGCSHREAAWDRTLSAKLKPAGVGHYDLVVTVSGQQSQVIDQATVKGIAATADATTDIRIDPRHCQNYRIGTRDDSYKVKTLCTGISAIGVLTLAGDQVVLALDNLAYTEPRDMAPTDDEAEGAREEPKLNAVSGGGTISFPAATGGEHQFGLQGGI